jgi:hypothetical protein
MLETRRIALVFVLILVGVVAASANSVIAVPSSPGGQWNTWTKTDVVPAIPDGNPESISTGGAFWDNASKDSSLPDKSGCNVGWWLSTTRAWGGSAVASRCTSDIFNASTTGPDTLSYYSSDVGKSTTVGWEMTAIGPIQPAILKLEVAGWRDENVFGWYDASNPSVLYPIFAGGASPDPAGVTVAIAAGTQFGFYLCPKGNCDASAILKSGFSTVDGNSNGLPDNDRSGKFALFSEVPPAPTTSTTVFWVGVEDTRGNDGTEKWGDFNDMLIKMTVVPEPGFYGALALMMSGLYVVVSRRRKNQS